MPLSSGTKLGPYEIVAPLGAGGMGEVYRARDTRLDRVVAIKILPPHLSSDPSLKQRFEREAKLISSLNHPHICVLHDIGSHDGTAFLVMECVEGETLVKRLEKGPLPLAQVLKYGMQIADALDRAHRSGVVHRDLKPGNIMLTASGAKLLDFGLAKTAPPSTMAVAMTTATPQANPITERGFVVGTFQYMSPEQVEGREVDARSDIFSFGSVLYEMVTGRPAFQGKSQISVASAILEKDPEPVSSLQPLTPPTLDHAIRVCLAKEPEDRWQTARDVYLQLKWISEAGSQAGVPSSVASHRTLRKRVAWAAAAILTVAAIALAIAYLRHPRPPQAMRSYVLPPPDSEFFSIGNMAGPVVISPDGRKLAFVARSKDGRAMLWVRPLDSLTAQPLAGTEDASYPFWAPDSRFIGFFADSKLKKIDSSGGPPQALCDVTVGRGGAWNQEGTIIFSPGANDSLFRVPASGGTPAPATELDMARGDVLHRWPHFLPDGKHFIFFNRSATPDRIGIYLASLDAVGQAELLLRHDSNAIYAEPGYLLYVREQTLMAHPFDPATQKFTGDAVPVAERVAVNSPLFRGVFSASANGVLAYQGGETLRGWQLMWYDRSGKQLGAVGGNERYQIPRLSPDGKKVSVSIVDQRTLTSDIWIFDLGRGTKTRLTFSPENELQSVWSPDGEQVFFGSTRKGPYHIYKKAASGLTPEQALLETSADDRPTSMCRDGSYLAYQHHDPAAKTRWDIWALPLTGDRKPFPLVQSQFFEFVPMFSSDCKWVVYQSNESGRFEIYLMPFPSASGKWQVSTSGGTNPRWGSYGKELFYIDPANQLMAVDVRANNSHVEVGTPHALFATDAMPGPMGPFDVHPDGKRFLINLNPTKANSEPVTLVVNWTADLPKQ